MSITDLFVSLFLSRRTCEEKTYEDQRESRTSKTGTKSKREKSNEDVDRRKELESKSDQSRQERKQVRSQDGSGDTEIREPTSDTLNSHKNHHTQNANDWRGPLHLHENYQPKEAPRLHESFGSREYYDTQDDHHSPEARQARNQMDLEENTELREIDMRQTEPIQAQEQLALEYIEKKLEMSTLNPDDRMQGGPPSRGHGSSQNYFNPHQPAQQNYFDQQ